MDTILQEKHGFERYKLIIKNRLLYLIITGLAGFVSIVVDISTGPANIPLKEVFQIIIFPGSADKSKEIIIWSLRLPMAVMAVSVGASLSVAGAEMQTILSNPLASPYTLGISAGAGFGAALAMVLGVNFVGGDGSLMVSANAFIFSILTCILIFFISEIKGVTIETMVLTGIALLFLFSSLLTLLQYLASEEELQAVIFWLFGSLQKATWKRVFIISGIFILIFALLMRESWSLTALRLGDERAEALGIRVKSLRLRVFIYVSTMTASAVCFVGTIGFIGLVGPHIARIAVGEEQRFFIPMSAFTGALLLSFSSVLSKVIIPGILFPIGIITSFIGVPFFITLILTKNKIFW